MRSEVARVAQGLVPILREQQGYQGLNVLTDAHSGEGMIISYWETQADAEASETNSSYIGQMSMMSSFLQERLTPRTKQAYTPDPTILPGPYEPVRP
jgi:hypothetical protein